MITDIHTHIYSELTYQAYFSKGNGQITKAIVMHWYKESFEELLNFAGTKNNLFITGTVDMNGGVEKQLTNLRSLLQEKKIVGIKLYPGYQYFYASDPKVYPIAQLCQEYNKPLIFHSGDVWDQDNTALLKYSHPLHVDELAVKFPGCNIIIAHFGFPYFLETANVLAKDKNVFTDISGTIDTQSPEETKSLANHYVKDIKRAISYYPEITEKIMFGTDYSGEDTPLNQIDPYIQVIEQAFPKGKQENVFYSLADKLFL